MLTVIVTTNPYEIDAYTKHECVDLIEFIRSTWEVWPETARIYLGNVSEQSDITPNDERDIELLGKIAEGEVYIVIYPGDPGTIALIGIAVAVISAAAFLLLKPGIPDAGSTPSANNSLSDRSNKARPNSRIPDIFGQVRSIPDLLALPYRIYENNQEIEIAYMCVGRGAYELEDVRDGDTLIGSIAGAGATFYGPNTSPNDGTPQLIIGSAITQDLYDVVKLNEVNGQTLSPPNSNTLNGSMRFVSPNVIEGSGVDFTTKFDVGQTLYVSGGNYSLDAAAIALNASVRFEDGGVIRFEDIDPSLYFSVGQTLYLSNASYSGLDDGGIDYLFVDLLGNYEITAVNSTTVTLDTPEVINADWDKLVDYASDQTEYKLAALATDGSVNDLSLDGSFTIVSVSTTEIVLSNPEATNTDYLLLDEFPGDATPYQTVNLSTDGVVWVGWFDVPVEAVAGNKILINIVALQGVYGINKAGEQYARSETVTVEIRPIDKDGTVLGAAETFGGTLTGSATEKKQIALTIEATPTFSERAQIRVRRTSPTDLDPKRQAIDELKWESSYGLGPVTQNHFGNVTTVFTRTYATQSAIAVKERRLNCLAVRKIPTWDGSTFVADTAQTSASAIICAVALDEYIGNRSIEELNVAQIYAEIEALQDYFGFAESTDFNYTFDDDNISFEETISTIAEAVFSTAYRLGSIIHLYGEMANDNPLLLFNHRNKVPGSETRTVTFGNTNDYDGVELTYTSPDDDAQVTIYIPNDQTARNPKKIDTVGIRNEQQAMLHANRTYNKIIYQNTTTQFEALEEAEFLVNKNLILVSDNTRTDVIDGEIKEQTGLILRLSQPFIPADGVDYTIYLQLPSGAIDAIPVTSGADQWHVILDEAPSEALSLGAEQWVVALYQIVGNNEPRATAFILGEKEPSGARNYNLTAINYDGRYYLNDEDIAIGSVNFGFTIASSYIALLMEDF